MREEGGVVEPMIDDTKLTIVTEAYRAHVEAKQKRAFARRECLRLQYRMTAMSNPDPCDFVVMQNEIVGLLEEASEQSPELVKRN